MLEKRPQLVFRHFSMQCDYRTKNQRDSLEVIQFLFERCKSAELDGYIYDCMAHPTMRKRKHGCLSGVSKAGNAWFTLNEKSNLESLNLKHTQIIIPSLIGPYQSVLNTIKLSGTQNFVQLS